MERDARRSGAAGPSCSPPEGRHRVDTIVDWLRHELLLTPA